MDTPIIRHFVFDSDSIEKLVVRQAIRLVENGQHELWPRNPATKLTRLELSRLDRIGGREGFSGSRVFVADLVGMSSRKGREEIRSYPLLLKVAYGAKFADKLSAEYSRYQSAIKGKVDPRSHARVLQSEVESTPNEKKCVLWSEFISGAGMQNVSRAAPTTLRDVLNTDNHGKISDDVTQFQTGWYAAHTTLKTLYGAVLSELHTGSYVNNFAYFQEYEAYRKSGWIDKLEMAIDPSAEQIRVLNRKVRNPTILYRKLLHQPNALCGRAHVSAIHGDLHPNNVLVTATQPALLIDFGLSTESFHTIADFVVMEASIKFFSLNWYVSREQLRTLEDAFSREFLPNPSLNDEELDNLVSLIRVIRVSAARYLEMEDYKRQYLVPLYFVTMGLFKYASQVNNLAYLMLSSSLLAEQIEAEFGI